MDKKNKPNKKSSTIIAPDAEEIKKFSAESSDDQKKEPTEKQSAKSEDSKSEKITVPREEYEVLLKSRDDMKDRLARLAAEFDNFKKRSRKELDEIILRRESSLLGNMIPVLDAFAEGLKSIEQVEENEMTLGFKMIHKLLTDTLKNTGVEEIDDTGKIFDPYLHEVMGVYEKEDSEPDMIHDTLQKGYQYKKQLIRPAKVIITSRPKKNDETDSLR